MRWRHSGRRTSLWPSGNTNTFPFCRCQIFSPVITLDCNCFYFVQWCCLRKEGITQPLTPRYEHLKPVIAFDRCQLGCCYRRYLLLEGWHPLRLWHTHGQSCRNLPVIWVVNLWQCECLKIITSLFPCSLNTIYTACVLGVLHYWEQAE